VGLDSLFELGQLAGEFGVAGQTLPELSESAHDGDIDQDGAGAVKHAGKHGNALFGEGARQRSPEPAST
jgi:hypothetical protein